MTIDGVALGGLSPLETASHILLGSDGAARTPRKSAHPSARAALEDGLRRALVKPPCLVAFSGGRDSSALFAVAMQVARTEDLPLPIPVTLRFSDTATADESEWQTTAVRHIGAPDWIELEVADELDLIGPVAAGIMREHGLPYPYNLHMLAPMIDKARGGTLVTGLGGDQVFRPAGWALDTLARRRRPSPGDALRIAVGLAPDPLRLAALRRRRAPLTFPWLTDAANSELSRGWLAEEAGAPFGWDSVLRQFWQSRFMQTTLRRIDRLANSIGAGVAHPFAEPDFVAALARDGGRTGFTSRTAAMDHLFREDLPPELIQRKSKASFNDVLWSNHTQAFVNTLDEARISEALARLDLGALVDTAKLSAHWSDPAPLANSFLLLQACWLALDAG